MELLQSGAIRCNPVPSACTRRGELVQGGVSDADEHVMRLPRGFRVAGGELLVAHVCLLYRAACGVLRGRGEVRGVRERRGGEGEVRRDG